MKRTVIALILVLAAVLLCGCGHIEDTNGLKDFSLAQISNEDIVHGRSSMSSGRIQTTSGGRTSISVRKYSGVQTLETFNEVGGGVLKYDITLKSGNLRAVLVHDSDIVAELTVNGGECEYVFPDNGTYKLKIAGETAEFGIKFFVQ